MSQWAKTTPGLWMEEDVTLGEEQEGVAEEEQVGEAKQGGLDGSRCISDRRL